MIASLMKRALLATTVAIGVAAAGGAAHADIIFTAGNNPDPTEENIIFGQKFDNINLPNILFGLTNQTHVPVFFNLVPGAPFGQGSDGTNGVGQADIVCNTGCGTFNGGGANGMQLEDLEIRLGPGFGATDFIGNLDFGEGTFRISVTDNFNAVFDFMLGNGQNFFTLNAINGEVITDILIQDFSLDANGHSGFNSFKQPRISGLCTLQGTTCTAIPVPEPSSLALFGVGLFAAGWFAMRRKALGTA